MSLDPSQEFLYIDDDGQRRDALLHADLLNSPDAKAADDASLLQSILSARARGFSDAAIQELYGVPSK